MGTLATLVVKLVGDVSGFRSDMDGAGSIVRDAGRSMSATGGDLTRNVTLPIVGIGTAATLMANEFNGGMANAISLVPEAAGQIASLSDDVQSLAVDVGQGTGDMTEGLYQVVSAFGFSDDAMSQLTTNAVAAKAGLATTAEAIALTSAVTKGYGDTSAEATQKAADLALRTVQLGQTTFPELAASIGRVTPLAASLGATQEELFAVMATGSGVTGGAAEVSTQLRGILQSLMAPTEDMTKLYTSLGYESAQAMLEQVGLGRTIQLITSTAESSNTPLQKYIGSIEGQTLAMALGGPQMDDYTSKLAEMQNAAGTAQTAFDIQTQGVNKAGFEMEQAAISTQVMTQEIGQALQPAILSLMPYVTSFMDFIRGLVQQFTELDPNTQKIIFGVLGLAAAIGPILMVLGPMVTGFGALLSVIGLIASPVGLVIGAIVLLGVAIVKHFGGIGPTIEAARNAISGALSAIRGLFSGEAAAGASALWANSFQRAKDLISGVMTAVQGIVAGVLGVIQTFVASHGDQIRSFFQGAWNSISEIVNIAIQIIQATVVPILQGIGNFIRTHGAEIQALLGGAWTIISNLVSGALELIKGILRAALAILQGDWSGAWEIIKTTVTNVWENIKGILSGALAILQTMFGPAFEIIKTSISTKWDEITAWFAGLPDTMAQLGRDLIQGMIDGIAEAAQNLKQFIEDLFGDVIAIAKRILGIKSPSSVFADIGGNLGLGFAAGIRASTPAAVDAVNAMMSQVGRARPAQFALATATAGGYGAAGQRAGQTGSQAGRGDTWNVTINVQGGGDARAVGRAAEDGMLRALRQVGRR